MESLGTVKRNIRNAFARKSNAVYALCTYYAALVIRDFRQRQEAEEFWTNRTSLAKDTMFSGAFSELGGEVLGFFMSHTMRYGVYLELANNRQNEAIRPIINEYFPKFKKDLARIYADGI